MEVFDCNVRLAGNVLHDVPRYSVSQKEIRLLRAIHGDDAVINIKPTGQATRDEQEELLTLARDYGRERVETVFKVSLDGFDDWLRDKLDEAAGIAKQEPKPKLEMD